MSERKPRRLRPFGVDLWRLYDREGRYVVLRSAELRLLGHRLINDANLIDSQHAREIKEASHRD
ncbi:hypothetical protein [Pseudoclavibacter helvolus]|uniref:hypothetical protein n=1 Tax=Pseudoclavibacter helvolus TaxID=255205 RepID=UPI0024ADA4FF|nr:hypothetical protein [Pseudoclavibacter helvolus]